MVPEELAKSDDAFFRPIFLWVSPAADGVLRMRCRVKRVKLVVLDCLAGNGPDANARALEAIGQIVVFKSPAHDGLLVAVHAVKIALENREVAAEYAVVLASLPCGLDRQTAGSLTPCLILDKCT